VINLLGSYLGFFPGGILLIACDECVLVFWLICAAQGNVRESCMVMIGLAGVGVSEESRNFTTSKTCDEPFKAPTIKSDNNLSKQL
jgi:hypothetical protein